MINRLYKFIFILIFSCTLVTCIDPYVANLENFEALLVVDALITDEACSGYVRLSRTTRTSGSEPSPVTGAAVKITDDLGGSTILAERYPGDYRTDSLLFRGAPGRTYTLTIETSGGDRYVSAPSVMYPVPGIDSLYFDRDQLFSEETGTFREGISFYIDTRGESTSNYYRWSYDEWWKFSAPDPKLFDYLNDSTILPVAEIKQTCWAHNRSDVIDIETTVAGNPEEYIMKPVHFVASQESDRLLIQYCLEVRQMSVSMEEYQFWNLMSELNEAGGDIFDKQPFQIISNITSTTDPDERVIGYFQVSGVKTKRTYVTFSQVADYGLPIYQYECDREEKGPIDYPSISPGGGMTFDEIYWAHLNSGYTFIKPVYNADNTLFRLVFVKPLCAECTVAGSLEKPWFWIDIE